MAIIKSEDGNPWDFADKYIYQSHVIEFGVLHNFAKEGPLYGKLIIDGSIVSNAKCNGFGGPVYLRMNCFMFHCISMQQANLTLWELI